MKVYAHNAGMTLCRAQDNDSRLPNIYELDSVLLNNRLIGGVSSEYYLSGTIVTNSSGQRGVYTSATPAPENAFSSIDSLAASVRCIKR